MEIFGIGPLELLLIVLIALIVLGPKEMLKTSQKAAGWIRKIRQSEIWSTTKEVMDIPNQVMRETGLDKEIHELQNLSHPLVSPQNLWQANPGLPTGTAKNVDESEAKKIEPAAEETAPSTDSVAEGEKNSSDSPEPPMTDVR
jgi:Sec-independent protein translocase protein TatA